MKVNKFRNLFFTFFIIMLLVFSTSLLSAAHTQTTTVTPSNTMASVSTEFTVNIAIAGGGDSVDYVKITRPTNGVGFSGLSCGSAPTDWALSDSSSTYCIYTTSTAPIVAAANKDFTATATTASVTGTYTWSTITQDTTLATDTGSDTTDVDADAPTISSAAYVDDTHIDVTLNELADVDSITSATDGGFVVTETSGVLTYTVTNIAPQGDNQHVRLTVANMLVSGKEGVTVTYASTGNGNVTDVVGNELATDATGVDVTAWDTTAPTFSSVALGADAYVNSTDATSGVDITITTSGAEDGQTVTCNISDGTNTVGPVTGDVSTNAVTIASTALTSLDDGTLTATCDVNDVAGNVATSGTDTATKDVVAPTGYSVSIDQTYINNANKTALSFTFAAAEVGSTYNYSIDDSTIGSPVTGTDTIATATDTIAAIDVSSLNDDTLTLTVTLTDVAGNLGSEVTDTVIKDILGSTVVLSATQTSPTNVSPINMTAQFNETVTAFVVGDITVGNGTADNFVAVDGDTYTFDVTPTGQGAVTVDVAGAVATDAAGNDNDAATQFSITYDTVAPTIPVANIVGTTIVAANDTIVITFDGAVVATDGTWDSNEFTSIVGGTTGTITLTNAVFEYLGSALTITLDYATDGMYLVNGEVITVTPAANAIKDAAGNSVAITPVVGTTAVTGDVASATVSNVTSTITNGSYTIGEDINVTIVFSEIVVVTGAPQLTLETGATDRTANYSSGSGTNTLTFTYTVQTGDTSSDLDYVATGSLALNGGTINDLAGNVTTLTLAAPGDPNSLGANKAIIIDTTAPTAPSSVHIASNNSTTTLAKVGNTVTVTATVDAGTTVTGTIGGQATTTNGVVDTTATLTRVLDGTETEGAGLDFTLVSTDAAGNDATTVTKADIIDGSAVATDFTAPTVILSNAHADLIVKDADADVVITATFIENMISAPTITIDGPGACDVTAQAMTEDANPAWTYTWNVPAACDGAATVTVAGFDLAGNAYAGSTNLVYVIDNTAPTVSSITPVNLNQSNVGAITVDITFDEVMTGGDTVTVSTAVISGTPAVTYGSWFDSNTWRGTFTLADNNEEVNTGYYTVSGATDVAGNSLVAIVEKGVNNILNVDTLAPTLTTVSIASDNATTTLAKVGDVITLTIISSENIASPSSTTIAGHATNIVAGEDAQHWTATYTMVEGDTTGVIPFTIDFTDSSGNSGTQVTAVTDATSVTFDKTAPVVSVGADIFTATEITRTATATDTSGSGIVSTVWSKFSGSGTITFGTSTALTTTISASEAGIYVIRLTATDNAGNVTTDDFTLTVGSYAFSYPSDGYLFDTDKSDAYFKKDKFTGMNIYDGTLTMEIFLNSAAGLETQRLIADDVNTAYVYTSDDGWTTLDDSEALFADYNLYSAINGLATNMDEIYMYFDFVADASLNKAIRHIPVVVE